MSAGGLGYARFASGTWGSLPPCVAVALLVWTGQPVWIINTSLVLLGLWASVACVRFGKAAEWAVGAKDPGCVVADEVAGMCIALLGLQWWLPGEAGDRWWWHSGVQLLAAFLLFRFFDVLKPPPCGQLQRVRGGWGILLDDVFAGVYASVCVHLLM
ncbi:MAG: phosphatidylglycerophosphatase A [Phycisphaerae bacterium]|nr:phosphatidylglycerophosphatase A [Phycisphaerae bacterium]